MSGSSTTRSSKLGLRARPALSGAQDSVNTPTLSYLVYNANSMLLAGAGKTRLMSVLC